MKNMRLVERVLIENANCVVDGEKFFASKVECDNGANVFLITTEDGQFILNARDVKEYAQFGDYDSVWFEIWDDGLMRSYQSLNHYVDELIKLGL